MTLTGVLSTLVRDPAIAEIRTSALGARTGADISAAPGAVAPLLALMAAAEPTGAGRPVLAVTATGRESEDLASALRCFLPADQVVEFPAWETLPHERLSPRSDTVGRRLAVLRRLAHPGAEAGTGRVAVVVAPVRALLQPLVKGLGDLEPVSLREGDELPLTEIVERLVAAAYVRTDLVERRGEFAVRGGILDVFPPTEEHPLRVELFGDSVEEVRWFAVADQRSLEVAPDGLWAPPCREVLLTDAVRERAAALATQLPGVADLLHKVAEGIAVEGMESLAPALVDGMELLVDVLPQALPGRAVRSGAGAHPGPRPGGDERRVPAGQLGQRLGRQRGAGRPRAVAGHRVVLVPGRRPRACPRAGGPVVVGRAVHR